MKVYTQKRNQMAKLRKDIIYDLERKGGGVFNKTYNRWTNILISR